MMKRVLGAIIAFFALSTAFGQYDPQALTALNKMSETYKKMTSFRVDFNYSMENEVENIRDEFEGEITVMGEMYRLDMGIQEIFNNGETVWTYMPEEEEVNITEFDSEEEDLTPSKIYTAYQDGYKYILLQNESSGSTNVIDLIPEDTDVQFFKVRMKINKSSNLIESWEIFDKNGNKYLHQVTKFAANPQVGKKFFEFDPARYPGVEVVDLR